MGECLFCDGSGSLCLSCRCAIEAGQEFCAECAHDARRASVSGAWEAQSTLIL